MRGAKLAVPDKRFQDIIRQTYYREDLTLAETGQLFKLSLWTVASIVNRRLHYSPEADSVRASRNNSTSFE